MSVKFEFRAIIINLFKEHFINNHENASRFKVDAWYRSVCQKKAKAELTLLLSLFSLPQQSSLLLSMGSSHVQCHYLTTESTRYFCIHLFGSVILICFQLPNSLCFFFSPDSSIKKMLALLEVELKKIREKEKKIYAGMFDRHAKKDQQLLKHVKKF